jgi:hypothetical protein
MLRSQWQETRILANQLIELCVIVFFALSGTPFVPVNRIADRDFSVI